MAEYISELYNKLKEIRKYLIKIGPKRRIGNIIEKKLKEASELRDIYNNYLQTISRVLDFKDENEKSLILENSNNFIKLFSEVQSLCSPADFSGSDSNSTCSETDSIDMAAFDLKTALSLLPILNDTEQNTKELIDGIEYYESTLDESSKSKLISFVLKTRLSQAAKLSLSNSYGSVKDLLKDMRQLLLPKKAGTAIQAQLQRARQDDRSVADFGKYITELFVDLTISQADGNTENYNVLRPINEKTAIKVFADGLRNRRLSTIMAARDFRCLKDAVQAAQEEEVSSPSSSADMLSMQSNRGRGNYFPNRTANRRGYRNRMQYAGRPLRSHSRGRGYYQAYDQHNYPRMQSTYRGNRGQYRGRYNNNRRFPTQRNAHVMIHENREPSSDNIATEQRNAEALNHFFRE